MALAPRAHLETVLTLEPALDVLSDDTLEDQLDWDVAVKADAEDGRLVF